jgi:hypothetical protein
MSINRSPQIEHMPDVESGIPMPSNAMEAMPELSAREELEMRARTIRLISDLMGKPIEPTQGEKDTARDMAQSMLTNAATAPQLSRYSNPTLAYLAGMVAQFDTLVVKELAELKVYVVNKLIADTEHPDARIRLTALRSLGEIDGVDAFKKRTEMTVKPQSMEEVERELLATLEKLERRTVNVSARVVDTSDVEDVEVLSSRREHIDENHA